MVISLGLVESHKPTVGLQSRRTSPRQTKTPPKHYTPGGGQLPAGDSSQVQSRQPCVAQVPQLNSNWRLSANRAR